MQLEQTLGISQPCQMLISEQREGIYTCVNLEYLSASALYSSRPIGSGPLSPLTPSGPLGHEKFSKPSLFGFKSKWEDKKWTSPMSKLLRQWGYESYQELADAAAKEREERLEKEREKEKLIKEIENSNSYSLTPKSGPLKSGFGPASIFGLGSGIAREMSEAANIIERIRKDDDIPNHLNYEYLVPGKKTKSGKQKWINLANIHIDLES